MHTSLLVFAKYPHPGKVKTRLAQSIGSIKAAEFYTRCAEYTLQQANSLHPNVDVQIFYSDAADAQIIREWLAPKGYNNSFNHQSGNNLGERMENAFSQIFSTLENQSVLLIGTDAPDINAYILRQAFDALEQNDVVLGPALDGGYYLIGMSRLHTSLFDGIDWSTDRVREQTMQKALQANLSVAMLEPLIDIDTFEDREQWLDCETTTDEHPLYSFMVQLSKEYV